MGNSWHETQDLFFYFQVSIGDIYGNIREYDQSLALKKSFRAHSSAIGRIKKLSANNFVATASSDHTVKIWNPSSSPWTLIRTYTGHIGVVFDIENINVNTVVTGSNDQTIRIWSLNTGLTNKTINAGFGSPVFCLKVFNLVITILTTLGFYSCLPNVKLWIKVHNYFPYKEELLNMDKQTLELIMFATLLAVTLFKVNSIVNFSCFE